jgi:hypothetical protein
MKTFTLTEQHLLLLSRAELEWESTGPRFDCKRPFGNKDIEQDMADILMWATPLVDGQSRITDSQRARLKEMHEQLLPALQIVLQHAVHPYNGAKPGTYRNTAQPYYRPKWELVTG